MGLKIEFRFKKNVGSHKTTYTDLKTGKIYNERQGQRAIAAYKGGYKLGDYKGAPSGSVYAGVLKGLSDRIDAAINKALRDAQIEIMEHADKNRKYPNLQGDLITSTMSALYHGTRSPVLMQLPSVAGRTSTGKYMLRPSKFKGAYKVRHFDTGEIVYYPASKVKADNPRRKGRAVAKEKLMGEYRGGKQGIGRDQHGNVMSAIVLTTGTEHASLLEQYRGLNVLSATRRVARKIVKSHIGKYLKQIKRK